MVNFKTENTRIRMNMREANMLREVQESLKRLGIFDCRVTNINISSDWRYATIYCISLIDDDDKDAAKRLELYKGKIGRIVKHRCGGHFFPVLRCAPDREARRIMRVEEILDTLPQDNSDNLSQDNSDTLPTEDLGES